MHTSQAECSLFRIAFFTSLAGCFVVVGFACAGCSFLTYFVSYVNHFLQTCVHLSSEMLPFFFSFLRSLLLPPMVFCRTARTSLAKCPLLLWLVASPFILPMIASDNAQTCPAGSFLFCRLRCFASNMHTQFQRNPHFFWLLRSPLGDLRPSDFPRPSGLHLCSVLTILGGIAGYGENRRFFRS